MKRFCGIGWGVLVLTVLVDLSTLSAAQHNSEGISGNIFGRKNGMIHPFLEITETHTDNLTNSVTEQESDLISVISPGVALAIPGTGSTDVNISVSTAAPGGLTLSRNKMDTRRRFQGLLIYNPEFKRYKDHSEEDFTAHNLKGALQYKAPGGLTIDIADKYQESQEMWGETGDNTDQATYKNNVSHAIVSYAFSPRLSFTASGGYHTVEYKDEESEFRDRNDTVYSGAIDFSVTSKVKLFCQYKKIDVKYDAIVSRGRDSTEDFAFAGVSWIISDKSQGTCKFGYMNKDFADPVIEDPSTWAGEIDLVHKIADRSVIMANAVRNYYETNLSTANYYTTNRLRLTYNLGFTVKLTGSIFLSYQNDEYDGIEIESDTYSAGPSIAFSPYKWLTCQLSYRYSERASDEASWEYVTNEYSFLIKTSF